MKPAKLLIPAVKAVLAAFVFTWIFGVWADSEGLYSKSGFWLPGIISAAVIFGGLYFIVFSILKSRPRSNPYPIVLIAAIVGGILLGASLSWGAVIGGYIEPKAMELEEVFILMVVGLLIGVTAQLVFFAAARNKKTEHDDPAFSQFVTQSSLVWAILLTLGLTPFYLLALLGGFLVFFLFMLVVFLISWALLAFLIHLSVRVTQNFPGTYFYYAHYGFVFAFISWFIAELFFEKFFISFFYELQEPFGYAAIAGFVGLTVNCINGVMWSKLKKPGV